MTYVELFIPNVVATDLPLSDWHQIGDCFKAVANEVPDDPLKWFTDYLLLAVNKEGHVGHIPPEACLALFDRLHELQNAAGGTLESLACEADTLMVCLAYFGRTGDGVGHLHRIAKRKSIQSGPWERFRGLFCIQEPANEGSLLP
jgi:hypothetical protein